jgi:hypothetical protein
MKLAFARFGHREVLVRDNEQRGYHCAEDGNRTRTSIAEHGILSPGRLPVPPLRHTVVTMKGRTIYHLRTVSQKK